MVALTITMYVLCLNLKNDENYSIKSILLHLLYSFRVLISAEPT